MVAKTPQLERTDVLAPTEKVWFVWMLVLFVSLTLGPVYQLRAYFGDVDGTYQDDWLILLWFGVVYTIGAFRLLEIRHWLPMGMLVVVPLLTIVCLSTLWSTNELRTLTSSMTFVGATVAALSVGTFRWRSVLWALVISQQVLVAIGVVAVRTRFGGAVDEAGHWVGVFFNRNSFAPVAGLGALATVLLIAEYRRDHARRVPLAVGGVLCVGADIVVLYKAESLGSVAALLMIAATCSVCAGFIVASNAPSMSERVGPRVLVAAVGVTMVGVVVGAFASSPLFGSLLGRSSSLSGRVEIWGHAWTWILEQPILGYGWNAIWSDSLRQWALPSRIRFRSEVAHNGYIEILIGTGIVGLSAFLVVIAASVRSAARMLVERGTIGWVALVGWGLALNLNESFVGGNHLPWVLLVAPISAFAILGNAGDTREQAETNRLATPASAAS